MANTTFKGPVRSQNGFQELVDGVWTPVGGGGGGGPAAEIYLSLDNAYSWDKTSISPTGPTAGTRIQIPNTLQVGEFVRVYTYGTAGTYDFSSVSPSDLVWSFKLPNLPPFGDEPPPSGTDFCTWFGSAVLVGRETVNVSAGGGLTPPPKQVYQVELTSSGPNVYHIYVYGLLQSPGYFDIMRGGNQNWFYGSTIWATYGLTTPINCGYQGGNGVAQLLTYPAQYYIS